MKMQSKIRAFFRYMGEDAEMEVSAAEIKNSRVYLHPTSDKDHVYCIESNAVDIIINPNENIQDEDIKIYRSKKAGEKFPSEPTLDNEAKSRSVPSGPNHNGQQSPRYNKTKMKKVTFTLYPDEYDGIMSQIKQNGYRKTEFFLACVSAAKKNSMESTYRKYERLHKERRSADRENARLARENNQH